MAPAPKPAPVVKAAAAAPAPAPTKVAAPAPAAQKTVSAPAAPAKVAAPVTGFSAKPSTPPVTGLSTGKKVAIGVGATALGGALYAAGANHEAVTAHQEIPAPAPAPDAAATKMETPTTVTASVPATNSGKTAKTVPAQESAAPAPQPQVVVIEREVSRHRNDDAYWYQRGRDSVPRDYSHSVPSSTQVNPSIPSGVTSVQTPTPYTPRAVTPDSGSSMTWLWVVLALALVGGAAYLVMSRRSTTKGTAFPARKRPNYTL